MIFQRGERVELVHTNDPHTRLRPGDAGTVTGHDQTTAGDVVHLAWDDGSRLSMCLDAGDRIRRILAATLTGGTRPVTGGCLLGEFHTDGHRYTAVPVARPTEPADIVLALRRFWWETALGEPDRFFDWVLTDAWLVFDPTGQTTAAGGERVAGIGVADTGSWEPVHGDLHHPAADVGDHRPGWLYLLDHDWEQVVVYEATVHGGWLVHSRHDLSPSDSPMGWPEPSLGDAAPTPTQPPAAPGVALVGISAAFTPDELEALVNTAAEAVYGDPDELSSRQRELAARAYALLQDAIDD